MSPCNNNNPSGSPATAGFQSSNNTLHPTNPITNTSVAVDSISVLPLMPVDANPAASAVASQPSSPTATNQNTFLTYLISGAIAGLAVDIILFPLDTIKTRMQSKQGFITSGGFKNMYKGILSAAIGSAPNAAFFFISYEYIKQFASHRMWPSHDLNAPNQSHMTDPHNSSAPSYMQSAFVHSIAASIAETNACIIRVPFENVKQKMQAGIYSTTSEAVQSIYHSASSTSSMLTRMQRFYTGFFSTVAREIPFAFIQFPIYELMRTKWTRRQMSANRLSYYNCSAFECCIFGMVSGAIAACANQPVDCIKTQMMAKHAHEADIGMRGTAKEIWATHGTRGFFIGVGPRVCWIGLGGAIFLGGYEASKQALNNRSSQIKTSKPSHSENT